MDDDIVRQLGELAEISRTRGLTYPIEKKSDFVAQMCSSGEPIVFRGRAYDPEWSSQLIPAFFFPVASERDLLAKAMELLMARGMVPLDAAALQAGINPLDPETNQLMHKHASMIRLCTPFRLVSVVIHAKVRMTW